MNVHTDAFVAKGVSHPLCEDYALQGTSPMPYWLVADGCSSADHSETAAQWLCLAAKAELGIFLLADLSLEQQQRQFEQAVLKRLALLTQAVDFTSPLLATLMLGIVVDNAVIVMVWGDGVVVSIDKDNQPQYQVIEYSGNRPFYLYYQGNAQLNQQYQQLVVTKTVTTIKADSTFEQTYLTTEPYTVMFDVDAVKCVACATDGVDCVMSKQTQSIQPIKSVLDSITSFKQLQGDFLQRRLKRWTTQLSRCQDRLLDDLSIAGMSIEE